MTTKVSRGCNEPGCERSHHGRGFCGVHYRQHFSPRKPSRPTTPKENAEQRLHKGGLLHPPISLPFRVLARSCACGQLHTTPDHLLRRDSGPLPACSTCRVGAIRRYRNKRADIDEDFKKKLRKHADTLHLKQQARTAQSANNARKEWTGPELEIAARPDLSALQVATLLGRTYYAVKHMRRKLVHQPREERLAGVNRTAQDKQRRRVAALTRNH